MSEEDVINVVGVEPREQRSRIAKMKAHQAPEPYSHLSVISLGRRDREVWSV